MEALRQGLIDASADADIWQAVKNGTLSARSSVTHKVGRQYYSTDTLQNFVSDGTRWQHLAGRGAFDSFDRDNNTNINADGTGGDARGYTGADSKHQWAEESGDVQITSGDLVNVSGTAIATVDTGGVLDTATYDVTLTSGSTLASFHASLILKYLDGSNHVRLQLNGASDEIALIRHAAAVDTSAATHTAVGLAANTTYGVEVQLTGSSVKYHVYAANTTKIRAVYADDEVMLNGAHVLNATKCGVRLLNTTNSKCSSFAVKPN